MNYPQSISENAWFDSQKYENSQLIKSVDQLLASQNQLQSLPINLNALIGFPDLTADNPELLGDLLKLFVTEAEKNVQNLQNVTLECNWREIALLAHRLKGSCGTFGAERLYDLCVELEIQCDRIVEAKEISQTVAEIAAELVCVKDFLEKKCKL